MIYDVAIIGAGVVGTALARTLSMYQLNIVVLDSANDVGSGTSKANTAILHTGFDGKPGSLEAQLVRGGYHLLKEYARAANIWFEETGAVLVAWSDEEVAALPELKAKAERNEYHRCEIINSDQVYDLVPELGPGALAGLTVPDESIIDPWSPSLAFAQEAKSNGVQLLLNTTVTGVEIGPESTTLVTNQESVTATWVVNAAGLGADTVDALFGYDRFTVTPRRGELLVFDKLSSYMVPQIVLPVPTALGKGVLISPTAFGNVMLGPTAEDLDDRTATQTSEKGFAYLREKGQHLMPQLFDEEVTSSYAGLRASTDHSDYLLEPDAKQRYFLIGSIRSTGLTSCLAIADHVGQELADLGLQLTERTDVAATPSMPPLGERGIRPYQSPEKIAHDTCYGEIVCFCERVTAGEIRDSLASSIPPVDRAGLSRRTRATNGRCQGFYCGAAIEKILAASKEETS